jgi:hypothetical protein
VNIKSDRIEKMLDKLTQISDFNSYLSNRVNFGHFSEHNADRADHQQAENNGSRIFDCVCAFELLDGAPMGCSTIATREKRECHRR